MIEPTREEIRAQLLKYAKLFIIRNCQYVYWENPAVQKVIDVVEEPNKEYEKFNEEHPNHGKPFTTEPLH